MAIERDHINQSDDTEEISKKDLLTNTGISYGQFYRWKRMGLIPEEWFRRRSAFTGQETYLPRRRVLERITQIQTLRERYSLEEIVELLSPDMARRRYSREDVAGMAWISPASVALFPGDVTIGYTFNDLLCLLIIEQLRKAPDITREQLQLVVNTLLARLAEMDEGCTERRLSLLAKDSIYLVILHCGNCLADQATHICITLDIDRLIDEMKVHLRTKEE